MAVKHFLGAYGHVNLDYIIQVPRLPRSNTSIQIEGERLYFGGTGANIARLASSLGVSTSLAAFVGEDFPRDFRDALRSAGVDISEVKVMKGYNTPRVWIFSDPKGNQMAMVDQGPMKHAKGFPPLLKTALGSEWVHFCTGRPEYYVKIAARAAEAGKRISVDPAQEIHYVYTPSTLRSMTRHAEMFFGNQDEVRKAAQMLGLSGTKGLLSKFNTIIETRSAKGSLVHEKDGTTKVPAVKPRKIVDPTGAGDAFRAGFYAGLSRGLDNVKSALMGSATASFTLEAKGSQTVMPSYRQVRARALKTGML